MSYPLGEELWIDDDEPGNPRARYRPVLAGFDDYQEQIDEDGLVIDHEGRLSIPDAAELGSFLLQIEVRDGEDLLDRRQRRVHVHGELNALWVDPPRVTVREGHRVRPRVLAVFDDPNGDGEGLQATAVELTDRAFGWNSSYTRRYIELATDDGELITLHDPADDGDEGPSRSWQLSANDDAGEAALWAAIRPDRMQELGLEAGDGQDEPLASPEVELIAAPAFDAVPEEHRRLRHVAGPWPAPARNATNILFLTEGFRADEWVDDMLIARASALLGASDPDDAQSLCSPAHAPWNWLLEEGRLNIFVAHLPSEQDGVTVAYRGFTPDPTGDREEPYDPPGTRLIETEETNPFRAQEFQRPPPEPDPDEDHEWILRHVLHVVGYPNRNDRDADHLQTIEDWHERFAEGGSVPAMFVEGASADDQPVARKVFDDWRRLAEPRFVDGRDTAFGLAVGQISRNNTHERTSSPRWGTYPDISHINHYLTGLLPPNDVEAEDPDEVLAARWMDPDWDPDQEADDDDDDPAGEDRPFVYLLINGVHVRGHHQSSDDDTQRYMVSGLHRNPPGTGHHVNVFVPDRDPDEVDRPDRHWRASLLPTAATMTEREETAFVGTVVHELHHAFGLGDEYEGSGGHALQAAWASNLAPPLEVEDDVDDGAADDGAAFLQRGLPWDVARARWADRIEEVDAPGDGTLHVTVLGREERHRPRDEVLGHLRIRRPLARREDEDDLTPPAVSDQLEVDEDASDYPLLVLRAVGDGELPPVTDAQDSVLFAPVLADEEDPGSWLRLISPAVRDHLEDSNTIMNPDHDCDERNPTITQPQGLPFDTGLSPSRLVGVYRGGGTTRCAAYRPTGISRMRSSYPEAENLDLHAGHIGLQLLEGLLDVIPVEIPPLNLFRAILEMELTFPPSVVEGYALADAVDPFVLAEVDDKHAEHVPDADQ